MITRPLLMHPITPKQTDVAMPESVSLFLVTRPTSCSVKFTGLVKFSIVIDPIAMSISIIHWQVYNAVSVGLFLKSNCLFQLTQYPCTEWKTQLPFAQTGLHFSLTKSHLAHIPFHFFGVFCEGGPNLHTNFLDQVQELVPFSSVETKQSQAQSQFPGTEAN